MAESSTRSFVSQWAHEHGQSREDVRVENTMQWLGIDRVAEQARQRQETHLESEFDAMDFETRAAALEAQFFQPWHERPISQRSPPRTVARLRPQSASVARRAAENDAVGGSNRRTRPQSAKTRSDNASSSTQTESLVKWKAPDKQQASKWREMLARGPEFKQLTLRRLELETYELLYNTLQQPQVVKPQSTTRRRNRRSSGSGASTQRCRPEGDSPVLACGSGLHLARSRKKRQQEHDRQMMSGKGRQTSRSSNELDRDKSATDAKRAIQDKTRQRSKLLKKKTSQKQLQGQSRPDSRQEKQQHEPILLRQPSAQRTTRGPWVPAGSASSLTIRGISSNANEMEVPQDTRVAEVVDAFRSHAPTQLRFSKPVLKQLKKAQQSAREAKWRKSEQVAKISTKNVNADSRDCNNNQANQNDTAKADTSLIVLAERRSSESGSESLFSESPAPLTLVVPPLKLPPHAWEEQDTSDAHQIMSALSQGSNSDLHSAALSTASRHEPREQSTPQAEPTDTEVNETVVKVESTLKMDDEVGLDTIPVQERRICTETGIQQLTGDSNPNRPAEIAQQEASIFEQSEANARRFASIEDGYLAEDPVEQGSTGASTGVDESSPTGLEPHFAATEVTPLLEGSLLDPVSDVRIPTAACLHEDRVASGTAEAHGAGDDTSAQVETPLSRTKEINTELSGEVNSARSATEIEDTTHLATSKAVEAGKLEEVSESNNNNAEQPSSLENYTGGSSPDAIETGGQDDGAEPDGLFDIVTESLHDAVQDDALDLVEENIHNECRQSGDPPDETAAIVDKDTTFTTMAAVASQRQDDDQSSPLDGLPSLNMLLADRVEEVRSKGPEEYPEEFCVHNDTTQVMDLGTSTLQANSLEIEEPIQGTLDAYPAPDRSEVTHHASGEPAGKLELHGGLGNALPSVVDQNFSDTGDHQAAQYEKAISSNSLRSQSPNVELLATVPTSQPASVRTPSNEDEGKLPLPAVGSDHTPTNPFNSDAINEPRSPKKKSRKSGKTLSSKKRENSVAHSQSAASNIEPTITVSLSTQASSPKAKDGRSDRSEEDPLRSQKQSMTRSFLTRVASGKTMLPEPRSVQPQPRSRKQLVEKDDTFGITAESTAAGMDVDTQQKHSAVKEHQDIDGEPASFQVYDCQSNVEKYSCEDSSTMTTTERLDMAPNFASVNDSSTVASAVTNADANDQAPPESEPIALSASDDVELSEQGSLLSIAGDAASHNDPGANGQELMQKYHNAACKIQAQYLCFARRRLILDQLRFMVAKQRRQERRKSRQKGKKVVAGDAAGMTSESSSPMVVDRPQQEVQQVAPALINSENAVEVPSEASPCEAPEPSAENEKLAARKDSCEYAFDLFDGANEVGREDGRKVDVDEAIGEPTSMNATRLERIDVQQEDPAALLENEKDGGANAATSSELVQGDDQVSDADAALLPEVEQVHEQPAFSATDGGFLTPTELAFSDVVEENPTTAIAEAAEPPSRWERYVDDSTSKSYYFNPTTNKTQWTAPEDRDAAAVNSSRATLSTPRAAADAAGTWQEFLDEASGQMYYFNNKTGECSWELPAAGDGVVVSPQSTATAERAATSASAWIMYIDPASQAPYYVNVETLATSWEQPDGFSTIEPTAVREDAYGIAVDDHATLDLEI